MSTYRNELSTIFMSELKRLRILPTGVVSKYAMGHRSMQCNSLLWRTEDAVAVATARANTWIRMDNAETDINVLI